MRRLVLLLFTVLAGWALRPSPAHASGDTGCTPRYTLAVTAMSGCDSRLALGPANDTRVNLVLLMRYRRGEPLAPSRGNAPAPLPQFDWSAYRDWWLPPAAQSDAHLDGEGSRCRSNDGGKAGFVAAVGAAPGLTPTDRAALMAARTAFSPDCETSRPLVAPAVGAAARPWAVYLNAAAAFYNGDFDAAARGFAALAGARDSWLAETARYMAARTELNRAQLSAFDDWGEPDLAKVDRTALARAQASFDRYLASWPRGRYAASARGLLRRVWWLGGDRARLAAAYGALMAQQPTARGIDDWALAQEIDYKLRDLKPGETTDPLLLAYADLVALRDEPTLTAAMVATQRPAFARDPALYGYLQAAHAFYAAHQPGQVLRLLPDATQTRRMDPVTLSRQLLRGQALDAQQDHDAGGFWRRLLPDAAGEAERAPVELGLALHEERAGDLDTLLTPGSSLTVPVFRQTLLATVADAAMLRRSAQASAASRQERDLALFVLLWKELSRGTYAAFVRDLALVPADAPTDGERWSGQPVDTRQPLGVFSRTSNLGDLGCPALRVTATALAADPRASRARLCLADFVQANGFDETALDEQPPAGELGGSRSRFPGRRYERAAVYRELLAAAATPAADKAYALYRAINCYAPGGYNSCGGAEVPRAQRRAWFNRLKADYPRSPWAQKLRYYW